MGACLFNGEEYAPYLGVRFRNIQITDAEQIDSAFLQFSSRGSELVVNPIPLKITGQPDPHPPPFSYEVYSISSKPRTENHAVWPLQGGWNHDYRGPNMRTPDVAPILREIISQEEWQTDSNAVVFIIENAEDSIYRQIGLHSLSVHQPSPKELLPELIIFTTVNDTLAPPSEGRSSWVTVGPNPISERTLLRAKLQQNGELEWSLYDAAGRQLHRRTLLLAEGEHEISLEGLNTLDSGIYFLQVRAGGRAHVFRLLQIAR